ncbi:MAG: FAD-dependent oxidoreductase [Lachnospiraceae bacterium]|nr:FAD-dependent oxidoreductase [Lachnospiraceae bacterium]
MKAQLVVIGGGPAGMAAALKAYENGVKDILILERDNTLGGILNQCIHNGFGLHTFKEELTGPEYALRYVHMLKDTDIKYMLNTMVIDVTGRGDKDNELKDIKDACVVTAMNGEMGLLKIEAEAVVLAMGCREKTRGALNIPGFRPSGVFTAGCAQRYSNIEGLMCGKKVVIVGSGDIGLIMARRMVLEGAKVICVAEIMPYSGGLRRNIMQCLDDYDIPLYFRHTVTKIEGKDRLTGVVICEVGDDFAPIPGTKKHYDCDTLLLSCGLIPENELSVAAGMELDPKTGGPFVNKDFETPKRGIFACGNVLHVHDLVDNVSKESVLAGEGAAKLILEGVKDWGEVQELKLPAKSQNTIPKDFDKTRQVICIRCPRGCLVTADKKEDGTLDITGNSCPMGFEFATNEMTAPKRTVTSFVSIKGKKNPVPVKTKGEIPKSSVFECMKTIKAVELDREVKVGDVIIENVAGTGIDVVATGETDGI